MKQKLFFATKSDLEKGLLEIESKYSLKYTLCRIQDDEITISFSTLFDYNLLGIHPTGNHTTGARFIVSESGQHIKVSSVTQKKGGTKYFVEPIANGQSIAFEPGGRYQNEGLVHGSIFVISDDKFSNELYNSFSKVILKGFTKVEGFYVGVEAMELMKNGCRLITISAKSPREIDLTIKDTHLK